jgi:transposase InsO family protein
VQPAAGVRAKVARCSNAVWTIDLKGWFRTGDGSKVEPLTVRDFWSRYLLWIRHLAPRDERAVRRVCERLFRRHGRPLVMRCDLGSLFLGDGPHGFTRLSLWWWRLGIQVEFVRHGFVDNNAHEQRHRVLKADTARPPAHTLRAQARRLARWRRLYNHHRPHEALGLRPPSTRYRSAPALLPPLAAPHYPKHWLVRRVRNNGEINLPGWSGSIGRAFSGLSVGLQPTGPQRFRVYFANLVLGELDLAGARKLRIRPF